MPDKESDGNAARPRFVNLRPEARPALYHHLDEEQTKAYDRILYSINEALPEMQEIAPRAGRPKIKDRLRHDRASRLVFLSGARGTGKTTVLLSLINDLELQKRGRLPDEPLQLIRGEEPNAAQKDKLHERRELLFSVANRVVWLEPLDMEPLAESSNLLAAILARIDEAVQEHFGGFPRSADGGQRGAGLLDPGPEFHRSMLKLQQLQSDVALAWDGNLTARAGHLDLDVYAIEVMRVEKVRLGLNQRFMEALDGVVAELPSSHGLRDPLFVLPIDDFDINPTACLPLLRLLRLISVPRLFTIVLGDIDTATTMLNLKVSGDLARTVSSGEAHQRGGFPDPVMLSIPPTDIGNVAGEIAFNALRKLVPPGQRIFLEPLTPKEALDFQPLGQRQAPSLQQLFDLVRLPQETLSIFRSSSGGETADAVVAGKVVSSLKDLVLFPHTVCIKDDEKPDRFVTNDLPYSGVEILRGPLRKATDLWYQLNNILAAHETEARADADANKASDKIFLRVLDFFADFCQEALAEDSALAALDRRTLPAAIGGITSLANFDLLPLRLEARTSDERRLISLVGTLERKTEKNKPDTIKKVQFWGHLRVRRHRGFFFRVYAADTLKLRGRLRSHTAAALMLYHDLLILSGRQTDAGDSMFSPYEYVEGLTNPKPRSRSWEAPARPVADALRHEGETAPVRAGSGAQHPPAHPWALVTWRVGRQAEPVRVSWPLPQWRSFWEVSLFLESWNDVIELVSASTNRDTEKQPIEWLAYVWISIATAIVGGGAPEPLPIRHYSQPFDEQDKRWSRLLGQVAKMLGENSRDTPRGRRIRDWASRICLFCLPEFGLEAGTRETLCSIAAAVAIDSGAGAEQEPKTILTIWKEEEYFLRELRTDVADAVKSKFSDFTAFFADRKRVPSSLRPIYFLPRSVSERDPEEKTKDDPQPPPEGGGG